MKIAVSGKGGVGKTTIAAGIATVLAGRGIKVLAVDADPASSLGLALGFKESPPALIDMKELIAERTESKPGSYGAFFRLNPKVDDLPEKFSAVNGNIRLVVMGGMKQAGSGCACPENAFVKSMVSHLILQRDEALVMDMEAGLEHLGRGTATGVDILLVVVEPSVASVDVARKIIGLAHDLKIRNVRLLGSKVRGAADEAFLREAAGADLAACVPFSASVLDRRGSALKFDDIEKELNGIVDAIARWKEAPPK